MTWYKVPVSVYLEASDEIEAVEKVLDSLQGTIAHGGPAEEMSPEQMQPLLDLEVRLDQAVADSKAGLMIEVDGFPGLKFTPEAASQLATLRFEKEDQP